MVGLGCCLLVLVGFGLASSDMMMVIGIPRFRLAISSRFERILCRLLFLGTLPKIKTDEYTWQCQLSMWIQLHVMSLLLDKTGSQKQSNGTNSSPEAGLTYWLRAVEK